MPTIITGPVRLPDGTVPAHGRIIFQRRSPRIASPLVLPGPVEALIDGNASFTVSLLGDAAGTVYSVRVEYFPDAEQRNVSVRLPDVVVDGTGEGTLASYSAVPIPDRASDVVRIKQGATLNLGLQYLDANNRPQSLEGVTVNGWIARDTRIPLTLRYVSQPAGTFEATLPASVTAGLSGAYELAFRFTAARTEIRTGTLIVEEVA